MPEVQRVPIGQSVHADASAGMRELVPTDEGALRALVRKVYGDTYSYLWVYEEGGIANSIRRGQVSLWGDFAATGELTSHTGFFRKDPRSDYIESGMSLRDPVLKPMTADSEVWRRLFEWLRTKCVYLHQNTTTYHPLAQRYAERHMRASPTGLIVDYAVGERLLNLTSSSAPMHALTMTTVLDKHPQPEVRVPRGPWSEWLARVASGLGLVPVEVDPGIRPLALAPIEHNTALNLMRRSIEHRGSAFEPASARIDLVHVPLDERLGVLGALLEASYVPVGLRPHATRPHELVLQHLPGERREYARKAVETMRLLPAGAELVNGWSEACRRTS